MTSMFEEIEVKLQSRRECNKVSTEESFIQRLLWRSKGRSQFSVETRVECRRRLGPTQTDARIGGEHEIDKGRSKN